MDLVPHLLAGLEFNFQTLPEQLVNGLFLGAIYALIALGYTMVYGVLRLINFAHGEVYMLGAYVALFMSYWLGYTPQGSKETSSIVNLLMMLVASMVVCAIVGVLIERFAYRPMRGHSRIASLITAIGVSLFLQYGGALFLPSSPPPSINEKINPFRGSTHLTLKAPDQSLKQQIELLKPEATRAQAEFDAYLQSHAGASEFDPGPEGKPLKDAANKAQTKLGNAEREYATSGVGITIRYGELIIFCTSVVLMLVLTYLVMFTKAGRAMRAVSHDFDSASLMGVDVNKIITYTFIIGSALAGAGAMMNATFKGTGLTTFFGLLPGVKAFVAAVLGGIGNIPGAVLGGLLMGMAETVVIWMGQSQYSDAIAFVVLIVVLLVKPGGLLGSNKVEKV
ncbi:MAG: branched-chain amino acid ABC transporter permease [Fimbriimonas sp.]